MILNNFSGLKESSEIGVKDEESNTAENSCATLDTSASSRARTVF